jgi:pyoverdine/dityrosine biosynthesis protein Dit1
MWLDELRSFVYCIKNSLDDIISGNSDSEKVDQDQVSYYKDILHSSMNDPNITHATIYIVKVHMTWFFCLNCTVLLESTLQVMKNGGYSFFISHLNPD